MPLPQEVINRLSEESPPNVGWTSGLFGFSIALFVFVVVLYAGIAFGYEPIVNGQITAVNADLGRVSQSVSPGQTASLIAFYSQVAHVKSLVQGHVFFSGFLTWLSKHTEANAYFTALSLSSANQVSLTVLAKTETDLNEQIAVFESDPNVVSVNVSNVSIANVSNFWQANLVLLMKPSIFTAGGQ
jgi:hypothetical protein